MSVRVRYAPSPTGPQHIGGIRTALFNYLFARKNQGVFILRIEDTDQKRFVPESIPYLYEALSWLGIKADEGPRQGGNYGPYIQSERLRYYQKAASYLIENGHAYYAFDTPEEIEHMRQQMKEARILSPKYGALTRQQMKNSLTLPKQEVQRRLAQKEPYVVRFKVTDGAPIRLYDEIRGWIQVDRGTLDDKVLLKADGGATYHLAHVVDDHHMKISHVIRGEEWLPSAPFHQLLHDALGYTAPKWVHLPLILKANGQGKLSKRQHTPSDLPVFPLAWTDPNTSEQMAGFKESGYLKEAVLNFLALLGWHPQGNQEIYTLKELEACFALKRITKSGARFDPQKAAWFNQKHIQRSAPNELDKEVLHPWLLEAGLPANQPAYRVRVIELLQPRLTFKHELKKKARFFFEVPQTYDLSLWKKASKGLSKDWLIELADLFKSLTEWKQPLIKEQIDAIKQKKSHPLLPLIRLAISGERAGPELLSCLELLGQESVCSRLTALYNQLPSSPPSDDLAPQTTC